MRFGLIALLIFSLTISCHKKAESTKSDSKEIKRLPRVTVSRVKQQTIKEIKTAYGLSKPFKTIDVFSKVNGRVLKKFYALGQSISKDGVLAVVRQDIPGMEFADHEVKAPMAGIILQDFTEEGASVTVQKPLLRLAQLDPLLIEIKIPEEWQSSLNLKHLVPVHFMALPDQKFEAHVFRTLPQNDPQTHSLILHLTVANPHLELKANMFVSADFTLAERTALTIPIDALVRSGLEYFVFTIKDQVAHKQLVDVGDIFDNRIEIRQGLSPGQNVVVFGQNLLDEGVQVVAEEAQ